jgi:hypothetical protein
MVSEGIRAWLLEPSDPSVRYRTLTELLGVSSSHPDAICARKEIAVSSPVQQILSSMHPSGYWLQMNPRTHKMVGDGVEYGSFATTHFCLSYLAHLGMNRTDPGITLSANRYLDLAQPDGDWGGHMSCLLGYNIQTLIMLGFGSDKRLKQSIQLLLESARPDGGYLCDPHEAKPGRRSPKSCIRGSLKALTAFCELGQKYWDHPSCKGLIGYFLNRDGIFAMTDRARLVNKDVGLMIFPFHWRAGLVEALYILSRMGHGRDPRLDRAWKLLETKSDKAGRFVLDWTPSQSLWKVGTRGQPNRWMTLYSLLAYKARESSVLN